MIGSQKVAKFNNNKQKSKWLTIITTVLQDKCIRGTGSAQIVVRLSQSFLSNQIHPEKDSYYAEIVTGRKDLTNLLNKSPSYFTRVIYLTRKLNNLIEFMSGKKSVIKLYADALSGVKI